MNYDYLKVIVLESSKELGNKINKQLNERFKTNQSYIIPISSKRFSNGEGKVRLEETVRDKDIYILSDVGNYSISYDMHGKEHDMSPDEHFQDIKRVISATSGHARKITVIMPLLYQSRQHKRNGRESLDCALALQELQTLGVNDIVTFDAHDPNVSNAIPNLPFENFYPTHSILNALLDEEKITEDLLVISPDFGAMERARYYAEMLGCDVGVFYKRRDLSQIINGKNPVIDHVYLGKDVKNKNIIVVDDMIASGDSILEVARKLKEKGAKKVYLVSTFALLTEGPDKFIKAKQQSIFDKLYTTNLSYVSDIIKDEPWYYEVDCSLQLSIIIDTLYQKKSIEPLFGGKEQILEKLKSLKG